MGSIPKSGRSPGEENGNPLQYSCLGNPMDRGAWWATVHRVKMSQTQWTTEHACTHTPEKLEAPASPPTPTGPQVLQALGPTWSHPWWMQTDAQDPSFSAVLPQRWGCLTGAEREGTHCWYLNQVSHKTEMKVFCVRELDRFQGCCGGQKKCPVGKRHSITCSLF